MLGYSARTRVLSGPFVVSIEAGFVASVDEALKLTACAMKEHELVNLADCPGIPYI